MRDGMMEPEQRHTPKELPKVWRTDAVRLRRLGADPQAQTLEACSSALERAFEELENEPLTVKQAAEVTGLSRSYIYKLLSEGELPNAGRKGRPRIRRRDLPGCAF